MRLQKTQLYSKKNVGAAFLTAKSVARAPDHLLRTIDQLGAAGWDSSAVELPALCEIATRFHRRLMDCGFGLIHIADRRALNKALTSPPLFAEYTRDRIDGAHWPLCAIAPGSGSFRGEGDGFPRRSKRCSS